MFKTIIAAVDGRTGGHDAGVLARRLAAAGGARVILAHVHSSDFLTEYDFDTTSGRTIAREAEALVATERAALNFEADGAAISDTSVGRGLHSLARREHADLIVVGSCHRGTVGRIAIGDEAAAALHGAPCAVAVAPRGFAQRPAGFATIGVGYDGSPESEDALAAARDIAEASGASIHLLDVVKDVVPMWVGFPYPYDVAPIVDAHKQHANALVDTALRELGVPADGEVTVGLAGDQMVSLSARTDLLVVGSRGYGPARSVLLGSTSSYLVHHAHCPVIVMPRGSVDHGDLVGGPAATVAAV